MVTSRSLVPAIVAVAAVVAIGWAAAPAHAEPAAHAEPDRLAAARRAIDDVRYDRAQELLGEALRQGGSSPEEMIEIYALAASTAVVLDKEDLGELYYRRLLCIDPKANLDADLAPKFRRAFAAARAYVSAHGALRVRTRRQGDTIEVVVESDPLAMVSAISLRGADAETRLDSERRAVLPLPDDSGDEAGGLELLVLDELGNHLQVLPLPDGRPTTRRDLAAPARPTGEAADRPSFLRTWWIWTIPAAASLAVGIGAGLQSQSAGDELDDLLGSGRPFYYQEADELRARSRRYATVANVSFGAAGVFALVAGIMLATRPSPDRASGASGASGTALSPMLRQDGAVGLVFSGNL